MEISHCYWHLVVKNGNFTLLLDIWWSGMAFSIYYWHLVVMNANFSLLLTFWWSRMAISHCYWHLVVKNANFTVLLISSGQEWQFHIATDIYWSGMVFHMAIDIWWSRMAISHCYWHLVVNNGNISLLVVSHCYWHLVVNNGNLTFLLTSGGQEWQFHIPTDIWWSTMAISHCY